MIADCGIVLHKNIEVRDATDFNDAIQCEFNSISNNNSETSTVLEFAKSTKPVRPGRGKAKVSKFVSDLI